MCSNQCPYTLQQRRSSSSWICPRCHSWIWPSPRTPAKGGRFPHPTPRCDERAGSVDRTGPQGWPSMVQLVFKKAAQRAIVWDLFSVLSCKSPQKRLRWAADMSQLLPDMIADSNNLRSLTDPLDQHGQSSRSEGARQSGGMFLFFWLWVKTLNHAKYVLWFDSFRSWPSLTPPARSTPSERSQNRGYPSTLERAFLAVNGDPWGIELE